MITPENYEAFFRNLAVSYKKIAHTEAKPRFAMMDIDEILSSLRGKLDLETPTMILENPEGMLAYKHEKLLDRNMGAFHILQRVRQGDAAHKREVMNATKQIGTGVVTKMHFLKMANFRGGKTHPILNYFSLDQVRYNKVGPIWVGCHGWRFEFDIALEAPLQYDPNDWQ